MTSLLHHDLARRVVSPQEVLEFDAFLGRIRKNQSPLIAHPSITLHPIRMDIR